MSVSVDIKFPVNPAFIGGTKDGYGGSMGTGGVPGVGKTQFRYWNFGCLLLL